MGRNSFMLCLLVLFSFKSFSQGNTGIRSKFFSVPEIESLASQQHLAFLNAGIVLDSTKDKDAEIVQRAGQRIMNAVRTYYAQKKRSQELKGFTWRIDLVNKKDVNAFCLPGVRIVIGTGMLEWAHNEGSLAVVIAHEIGHILAGHGETRLDHALREVAGGKKLAEMMTTRPDDAKDIFMAAYGAGNVGFLDPFSLEHELEADRLGMMFAGLAGYPPREAIVFWERMGRLAKSARQPVLMSAHRGDNARIDQMLSIVDKMVKDYYRPVAN